jgi:hypothetical protein
LESSGQRLEVARSARHRNLDDLGAEDEEAVARHQGVHGRGCPVGRGERAARERSRPPHPDSEVHQRPNEPIQVLLGFFDDPLRKGATGVSPLLADPEEMPQREVDPGDARAPRSADDDLLERIPLVERPDRRVALLSV